MKKTCSTLTINIAVFSEPRSISLSHSDFSSLVLNSLCCAGNCLANLGLEKDKLYVTTQQQYSSHILTRESAARMNDCDNTTGLPATRRQFLLTRLKPGDENILSKLIEKTPRNQGD